MYSVDLHYQPFLFRPLRKESIEVPQDLAELLEVGKRVQRFNYGNELNIMFHDTTECHTRRIALHVANLPSVPFLDHEKMIRMAWIHDLPESVAQAEEGSDVLSFLSNTSQDTKELEVAKEILSPADLHLYELMEYNKHQLKSSSGSLWDIDKEAAVFKIIDWVPEGLVSWVWYITRWLQSNEYTSSVSSFPPKSVDFFVYLPKHMYERIAGLDDIHHDFKQYIFDLLVEDFYKPVMQLWGEVPEERIPHEFRPALVSLEKFFGPLTA